jgi:preprotein translocase subunit SecA
MDYLKDGIGLRAMAQRDPLVEYQREGFAMFQTMMGAIREESVGFLYNLEVEVNPGGVAARGLEAGQSNETLRFTAPSDDGGVEVRNQRGLLERAATAKAQLAAAQQATQFGGELPGEEQPGRGPSGPQRGGPQRPAPQRPAAPAQRGAFGQQASGDAPQNRQQRRAAERGQ